MEPAPVKSAIKQRLDEGSDEGNEEEQAQDEFEAVVHEQREMQR